MKKNLLIFAIISFTTFCANAADIDASYKNSVSIQFGINGATQSKNSFELQFFPPDLSYAREIYEGEFYDISTSTFYDNISVKVRDTNFSYRVGQRMDFGIKIRNYIPYVTIGLGIIRSQHHYQTSPVYGAGLLTKITKRFLWVNEINFQDVRYQQTYATIANLSTGIVYNF